MKKIIIMLIMIFVCGVLAFTIPKQTQAEEMGEYSLIPSYEEYDVLKINVNALYGETTTAETFINGNIGDTAIGRVVLNNSDYMTSNQYCKYNDYYAFKVTELVYVYTRTQDGWIISNLSVSVLVWERDTNVSLTLTSNTDGAWQYNTYIKDYETMKTEPVDSYILFEVGVGYSFLFDTVYEWELEMVVYDNMGNDIYYYDVQSVDMTNDSRLPTQNPIYTYLEFTYTPNLLLYSTLYRNGLIDVVKNPTYISTDFDFLEYLQSSTTSFFETELIGDLSIADILLFIVSIGLLVFILRFFAGG